MVQMRGRGHEVAESVEKDNGGGTSRAKFLRLKSGESVRGVFLESRNVPEGKPPAFDSAEYYGHGDYNANINTHFCHDQFNKRVKCVSCDKEVPRKMLYPIAIYLLDDYGTGKKALQKHQVVIMEVTRDQFKAILAQVSDYLDEDKSLFSMAFKIQKTGQKTTSSYAVSPILKLKDAEAEAKLAEARDIVLPDDFYISAVNIFENDELVAMLQNYIPTPKDGDEGGATSAPAADDSTPIPADNDDLTKNF